MKVFMSVPQGQPAWTCSGAESAPSSYNMTPDTLEYWGGLWFAGVRRHSQQLCLELCLQARWRAGQLRAAGKQPGKWNADISCRCTTELRPLNMKTTTPLLRRFVCRLHTTHYKLFLIRVDVLSTLKLSTYIQCAGTVCSKYKPALKEVSNFSSVQYLWHSCVAGLGEIFRFPEQIKQLVKA